MTLTDATEMWRQLFKSLNGKSPFQVMAGYSIFAHFRPDKIRTPRLLPHPPLIPPLLRGDTEGSKG